MSIKDKLHTKGKYSVINSLSTDYRAEVIASGVIEAGQDKDKILIFRGKSNTRDVSKDIYKINYAYLSEDLMECLCIYTTRQGIYDNLPEGIFHQSHDTRKKRYHEEIIEEIKDQRLEEIIARRFFQPFEMAIDRILVDAQLYEKKFDKVNFHDNLKKTFTHYWHVFKLMDLKQSAFFIKIIPELYRIPTDFDYMGEILSVIFDIPFKVEPGKVSKIPVDKKKIPKLGKSKLGINSVLGGDHFTDGSRDIRITIGPMHPEQARLFCSSFHNDLLLKELLKLMLPFNYQREIKYLTSKEHCKFRLSSPTHTAYLGINTVL